MDVILINLKDPMVDKGTMDSVLKLSVDMVPLGLLYLATMLDVNGYSVEVIDFNNLGNDEDIELTLNNIISQKPKMIGLSVSTPVVPQAEKVSLKIREELANECFIILGGYHSTFCPAPPLEKGFADVVVRGEGEEIIVKLANTIIRNNILPLQELKNIAGISYKQNGKIKHNNPTILRIENLDKLPFPKRNFIEIKNYSNPSTIASTRGCLARCQFCAAGAWG
jgi:radical SAM superfamily enzyme YgiQ (UPF0313 family)